MQDSISAVEFIKIFLPLILILLGGLGWLFKHEREKRLQIEKQLSDKKYSVYKLFIDLYFDMFQTVQEGKSVDIKKITPKIIEIKRDLLIYGGDKVVKTFLNWQISTFTGKPSLKPFTEILIEMRKDMGYPKTTITSDLFLKSLIKKYYLQN